MRRFQTLYLPAVLIAITITTNTFASPGGIHPRDDFPAAAAAPRGGDDGAAPVDAPCVIGLCKVSGAYRAKVKIPIGDTGWVERWCGVCEGVAHRFVHDDTKHTSTYEAKGSVFVEGFGINDGEHPFSWMSYRPDVSHTRVASGYITTSEGYFTHDKIRHATRYQRIDGSTYLVTNPVHVEVSCVLGAPETILRWDGQRRRITGVKGVKGLLKRVGQKQGIKTDRYDNREINLWSEFKRYRVDGTHDFYEKTETKHGVEGALRPDQPAPAGFALCWYYAVEGMHALPYPIVDAVRHSMPPTSLDGESSAGTAAAAAAGTA